MQVRKNVQKDAINSTNKGINGNFAQILAEIQERDFRDRNREVAPLKPADDALLLDSTTLSIDEVITQALAYIQEKASISILTVLFKEE